MGQFYVYTNPNPGTRIQYPYLLDIQSDLLSELKTTIVIPLSPEKDTASMKLSRLNPSFKLGNEMLVAITQDIAGIDRKQLGAKVHDLAAHRAEIIAAVDFVISGL